MTQEEFITELKSIERYELVSGECGEWCGTKMVRDAYGDYVSYQDILKLIIWYEANK